MGTDPSSRVITLSLVMKSLRSSSGALSSCGSGAPTGVLASSLSSLEELTALL